MIYLFLTAKYHMHAFQCDFYSKFEFTRGSSCFTGRHFASGATDILFIIPLLWVILLLVVVYCFKSTSILVHYVAASLTLGLSCFIL